MHILRKYSKKKTVFYNTRTKKNIPPNSTLHKKLSKVYIPPAYKNVKMTDDIDANVLAIEPILKTDNNIYIVKNILKNKL